MKKVAKRVTAVLLMAVLLFSTAEKATVRAEETSASQLYTQTERNCLYVSEEELASGEVLVITADMLDENGRVVVEGGTYARIIVSRTVDAATVVLKNVSADTVVLESGSKSTLEVSGCTFGSLMVVPADIKEMTVKELNEMLKSGVDPAEVANTFEAYRNEVEKAEESVPNVVAKDNSSIESVQISGNASLNLKGASVESIHIQNNDTQTRMEVVLDGYEGKLSVENKTLKNGTNSSMLLKLKNCQLKQFTLDSQEKTSCCIWGDTASHMEQAELSGNGMVTLDTDAKELHLNEKSEHMMLSIYSDVEELTVTGSKNTVRVAACAEVTNASVKGDGVRLNVAGTVENADVSGSGSQMSHVSASTSSNTHKPAATPKPTATPRPTMTPEPTATPKPTTTPEPTVTPTPGGTGTATGGALVTPTPTTTPKPTTTPEPTVTPTPGGNTETEPGETPTTTPEEYFEYYEKEDGTIVIFDLILYDEETGEENEFGSCLNIPSTIGGKQVVEIEDSLSIPSTVTELILPEGLIKLGEIVDNNDSVIRIVLPASLEIISDEDYTDFSVYENGYNPFWQFYALEEIAVSKDNPWWASKDGCLYSKDFTVLYTAPTDFSTNRWEIPSTVIKVADNAFIGSGIETLVVPEQVQGFTYSSYAGIQIDNLEIAAGNSYFTDNGTYIMSEAGELVYVRAGVTEFTVPKNMTWLSASVFQYNGNLPLNCITVEEGNSSFCVENGVLYNRTKTTLYMGTKVTSGLLTIPEGVRYIPAYAFYGCSAFSEIDIPASVSFIGGSAFNGCSALREIDIPEGVRNIVSGAFWNCTSLERIYIPDSLRAVLMFLERNSDTIIVTSNKNVIRMAEMYGWTVE